MIPLIADHPIVMHRFPHGITGKNFYQKQAPSYFPRWIKRKTVTLQDKRRQALVVLNSHDTLMYLVNQGVLVFHGWLSSAHKIRIPDRIIFDLDPSTTTTLNQLRDAAHIVNTFIKKYGLSCFIMTTGSRGYHLVIPIIPYYTFSKVHDFAKYIAFTLTTLYPKIFTIEISKKKRKDKIFVDYLRNSYGQTGVIPYSVRAIEGAPVATPITWKELYKTKPQEYTIFTIVKKLTHSKNPWHDFENKRKKLPALKNQL